MKKTISMGIIFMFVFSLAPLAFAQHKILTGFAAGEDASARTNGIGIKAEIKAEAGAKEDHGLKDNKSEMLKSIKVVKIKKAEELGERKISQARLNQVKEMFDKAKDEFKEAKEGFDNERKKLKESIEKKDQKASVEHARNYLLNAADAMISHLEKIKAKVQENENIANGAEAKIIAGIDVQISEINAIKADVQAASTKEQVKESAKKIRDKLGSIKRLSEMYSERVVAARVEGIVNQEAVLEKRLDNVLEKAKEKGIEVNVSADISAFSEKISAAKYKYGQAHANISEAIELKEKGEPAESNEIKVLIDNAKSLLNEARDAIKESHEILKRIVKKIKKVLPDAGISSDAEVEIAAGASKSAP